jgi:hypothetical protein
MQMNSSETVIRSQLTRRFNQLLKKYGSKEIAKRTLMKQIRTGKAPFNILDLATTLKLSKEYGKD